MSKWLSRAYGSVKKAVRSTWTWVKKYGWPTTFSIGRVGSSAGGVVLSAEGLADKTYCSWKQDPNATAPPSFKIPFVFSVIIPNVNVSLIRNTAIFRFFGEPDSDVKYVPELPGEEENLFDPIDEKPGWFTNWTLPDFGAKWNGILIFTRIMLYTSLSFMFLNTVFSSMKLYELFLQLFTSSVDMSTAGFVVEIILALFFAVSNAIATLSLNVPTSMNNVIGVIKEVKKGNVKFTPAIAATACVGLLNLISTVMGTYYNTSNAFIRYKKMIGFLDALLSTSTTKILILLSTTAAVVSEISRVPFLYNLLINLGTKFRNKFFPAQSPVEPAPELEPASPPSYWLKLKILILGSALVDATFIGLINVNSFPYVIKDLTNLDPDNGIVKAVLISTGFSTSSVIFAANWQATELHEENLIKQTKNQERITRLEQVVLESDSDEEKRPLLDAKLHKGLTFFDSIEASGDQHNDGACCILGSNSESSDSDSETGYSKTLKKSVI